ncbi:hypothetical protein QQ045_003434 [Rhodiola kirilowii]
MISVLAQERLLGATLGAVFVGVVVFEQRKSIYQTVLQHEHKQPAAKFEAVAHIAVFLCSNAFLAMNSQIKDSVPRGRQIGHLWNRAVDQTFGPVIAYLSARGW